MVVQARRSLRQVLGSASSWAAGEATPSTRAGGTAAMIVNFGHCPAREGRNSKVCDHGLSATGVPLWTCGTVVSSTRAGRGQVVPGVLEWTLSPTVAERH